MSTLDVSEVAGAGAVGTAQAETAEAPKVRVTGYMVAIIGLVFLNNLFIGEESRAFSLAVPFLGKEFNASATELGLIVTVSTWVGLLGMVGFPLFSDIFGRRTSYLVTILSYSIFAPLVGLSQNLAQLTVTHSLVRIPGSAGSVNYMTLAETVPAKVRVVSSAFLNSSVPAAYMVAALVGGVLVPAFGWRAMFFVEAVALVLFVAAFFIMKETPAFTQLKSESKDAGRKHRPNLILPWKAYPKRMILGVVLVVCYNAGYASFSTWQSAWLVNELKVEFVQSTTWVAIWLGASIPAYWICGWLATHIGKKKAIPIFAALGAAALLSVTYWRWDLGVIFWLGLAINFFVTGQYGTGNTSYLVELFPAQIRGSVQASFGLLGGLIGSLGPTATAMIAGGKLDQISQGFIVSVVIMLALVVIFLFIAPETAHKELEVHVKGSK